MNDIESHFMDQIHNFIPDFDLSPDQLLQLRTFYENLIKWNQVMNLTAITEEEDVYTKHFLDSYSVLLGVPRETFHDQTSIIDIGTGAGFPGIPLAIAFPNIQFTLMDSLNKRINFILDSIKLCKLNNVTCIHSRAEDLGRESQYREQFDLAVSRAVANLSTLNEYCLPLVKVGGYFVAYKSEKVNEELDAGNKAATILGGKLKKEFSFYLPETDYRRTVLTYSKIRLTPHKYPRKAGVPSKIPLGT